MSSTNQRIAKNLPVVSEAYGLDSTPNEREEAETLEDRGSLKAQKEDPVRYGHKYAWLNVEHRGWRQWIFNGTIPD